MEKLQSCIFPIAGSKPFEIESSHAGLSSSGSAKALLAQLDRALLRSLGFSRSILATWLCSAELLLHKGAQTTSDPLVQECLASYGSAMYVFNFMRAFLSAIGAAASDDSRRRTARRRGT